MRATGRPSPLRLRDPEPKPEPPERWRGDGTRCGPPPVWLGPCEMCGRTGDWATGSYPSSHGKKQCVDQHGDIQKKSAIADVIEVVLKRLVNGESAICAQLPETGQARHDLQP